MFRKILFTLLTSVLLSSAYAQNTNETPLVYIIPIKKMIEPALLYVVRRGIDEAVRNNADAIILDMDTPGGTVKAAVEIIDALTKSNIPLYSYVGREAISGGAFIALATPNIYMAPGSVIGDITPILMGMTGGVQDLPAAEKEKMTSYVAAQVRSAAEQGGYDPLLAEAMVRKEIEYKVGDVIISKEGYVLTLTNKEAEQLVGEKQEPLLSKGTVSSIGEMLTEIGLPNAERRVLEVTAAERLARLIAGIAPILMMLGLGGLWLEFKTPGFGIFGIAGVTCLMLFFFGHHIAGLAGMEDLLIFAAGVTLLAIEIFITPGFGIMGISGLLLIFISFISAMSERIPGSWQPISFEMETFSIPMLKVMLAFIGSFALVAVAGKFLPKTRAFQSIALDTVVPDADEEKELLGLEGITHSDLRPSGTAYFGERKIDVVTLGDYIPQRSRVRIVEVHGNRIVVEAVPNS
jgi:membrane-bound serine protease (ClpP class)